MGVLYQAASTKALPLCEYVEEFVFDGGPFSRLSGCQNVRCNRQEFCAFIRAEFKSLVI